MFIEAQPETRRIKSGPVKATEDYIEMVYQPATWGDTEAITGVEAA
jgi:hypothetical protein